LSHESQPIANSGGEWEGKPVQRCSPGPIRGPRSDPGRSSATSHMRSMLRVSRWLPA